MTFLFTMLILAISTMTIGTLAMKYWIDWMSGASKKPPDSTFTFARRSSKRRY